MEVMSLAHTWLGLEISRFRSKEGETLCPGEGRLVDRLGYSASSPSSLISRWARFRLMPRCLHTVREPLNGRFVESSSMARITARLSADSPCGTWYQLLRARPSSWHCRETLRLS